MSKIKVRWVILKNDKIFLVKDSIWWNFMLPWWKKEKWETIKQTLYRELLEETWVKAEIEKFLWFREYIARNSEVTIQFLFVIKNTQDFENIDKNKCSHSYEWSEAWFYDLEYLKQNNFDYPLDLNEIIESAKYDYNYNLFL